MDIAANAHSNQLIAGRYRTTHLLGSGGFGAVYFATDERLRRPVAIKICSARRLAADEADEAAMLFEREALTLARLRHPGLTAIWDYFNIDDDWYLVMEYVPGKTLRDRMRRAPGPLPLAEALDYASQLCQVLQYLHSQHPPIVFRDLKPANIMITPDGRVKLIDFGIARLFSPGKFKDTVQFGTPGYAPPEQYGGQTEPRSDIYSLGVVLHQMLTGHNPASSPFRFPPASTLNGAITDELETLITDATEYKIERRITSAAQFCSLLEAARMAPALTQMLPQTGTIVPRRAAERAPSTKHQAPSWTHAPRTRPTRPTRPNNDGVGHSLLVGLLVLLMLGAVGTAAYFIREGIDQASRFVTPSSATAPSTGAAPDGIAAADQIPSLLVFTAPSPNGGRALYTANIQRTGTRDGVAELEPDDIQRRVGFGPGIDATLPAISPDGEQIAYTKVYTAADSAQQTQEVWILDVNGTDVGRQLLPSYAVARAPAWNQNGTRLAVEVANRDTPNDHDVVIVNLADNDAVTPLLNTGNWEGGPAWSPDGTKIAFHALVEGAKCMQLYTVDLKTNEQQQLTGLTDYDCSEFPNGDYWPDWATNNKITFSRRNLSEPDSGDARTDRVVVWDPTQPDKPRITIFRNETENKVYPFDYGRWSQHGTYLLFGEKRDEGYGLGYLSPNEEQKEYPLFTLELGNDYTNVRYADWR